MSLTTLNGPKWTFALSTGFPQFDDCGVSQGRYEPVSKSPSKKNDCVAEGCALHGVATAATAFPLSAMLVLASLSRPIGEALVVSSRSDVSVSAEVDSQTRSLALQRPSPAATARTNDDVANASARETKAPKEANSFQDTAAV